MIFEGGKPSSGLGIRKRVLIVCCEPRALAEIKMWLKDTFDVSIAATCDAAAAAMNAYAVDAVVIYIGKNRGKAFSVFSEIASHQAAGNAPILFLAEKDDESDEADAFNLGASDYSVKRHSNGDSLLARINLRILASGNKGARGLSSGAPANAGSSEEFLCGKTILIAEDIELNQKIITAVLSRVEGLTIDFASNGVEAVDMFKANPERYFLVFMDIYMPEMDGLNAAMAIRRIGSKAAKEVPIIALTASASEEEVDRFFMAGMNDYLEKPMDYEQFLKVSAAHCVNAQTA